MKPRLFLLACITLCTALPTWAGPSTTASASAEELVKDEDKPTAPATRFVYRSTNILRGNPIGLISDNFIGMRRRLWETGNAILDDNFIGVAFTPQASPAFARIGGLVEWQPLAAARVWANFEVVGYFGAFNFLQSFDSPHADFSDTKLASLGDLPEGDPARNYPTFGTQLTVGVDLQAKLGPVAARNFFRAVRGDYALRAGDNVYYDIFYDIMAPDEGLLLNNDTDLLWVTDFGLVAGVRATIAHAFYDDRHFSAVDKLAGRDGQNPNGPQLRVGPLLAYTFFDDTGSWFSRPTVIAGAQWHVLHRWRAGADIPQWIPMGLIAIQLNGDLAPWR